ncbi:MAG: Branched-chain-amino-acid aminotransferase [candidate division WS2 bacterium]|nr:Branched-chain-amino-acid aminotransferase [Candidatus Lithacetigena glycinireducens]
MKVYIDGKYLKKKEAKVSVFDHGFLYGDGVFEGIRAYKGRVFKLKEHIDRLYESAQAILLDIHLSREELIKLVISVLRINNLKDAYIRVVVSRGVGDLGLDPRKCPKSSLIIIADKIQLYPEEMYKKGLEIITVSTRRNIADALSPRIKSLNYLNNILAKIETTRAGVLEGIMLNSQGYVAEATGDNIFLVKNNILLTPSVGCGILKGITRDAVIKIAEDIGIKVEETLLTTYDVYNAEECFLTGTAAEVIPVVKVDGRIIGCGTPGKITLKLLAAFHNLTKCEGIKIFE